MAYPKKRVRQHIMEDRSIRIIQDVLPQHWVIREYKPDYGIDLTVELFDFVDEDETVAATLGETLFVQVKSTEVVKRGRLRVFARRNVERGPLQEDSSKSKEIEVASLQLETTELLTVQAIGSAIPVLLFLVELSTRSIYFVCLNDLIDKVILPEDPSYALKQTKVIHIPLRNCITAENPVSVLPLGTYAKRPKLYAAFEKFRYQRHEVELAWEAHNHAASEEGEERAAKMLLDLVRHFLVVNLRYDFWTRIPEWQPIEGAFREMEALQQFLRDPSAHEDAEALRHYLRTNPGQRVLENHLSAMELPALQAQLYTTILLTWRRLENLSGMYEEVGREWFLPTQLATLLVDD